MARAPLGIEGRLFRHDPQLAMKEGLSKREREVCERLVRGDRTRHIGLGLGISIRTVETHRIAIMRKTRCRNIVMLVRWYYGIADDTPSHFDCEAEARERIAAMDEARP